MISGLVVYLNPDERRATSALEAIRAEATIEVGERQPGKVPIVLECRTPDESQEITDWLYGLPGVAHVDVVFVDLEPQPKCETGQTT